MGALLAEVFVLGLVSGLDALAFVAVIVVSAQRLRNGTAFVTGWLITLVVLSLGPAIFVHADAGRRTPTHRHLKAWLYLILGVVLIVLALRSWQVGRRDRDEDEVPRWYQRLQRIGPRASFLTGLVLPSIPAAIAAGTATFHSRISLLAQLLTIVFFIAVSSISVVPPVVVLHTRPSAAPALARLNNWAFLRRHTITFVVLGVIGLGLIARSTFRLTHGW